MIGLVECLILFEKFNPVSDRGLVWLDALVAQFWKIEVHLDAFAAALLWNTSSAFRGRIFDFYQIVWWCIKINSITADQGLTVRLVCWLVMDRGSSFLEFHVFPHTLSWINQILLVWQQDFGSWLWFWHASKNCRFLFGVYPTLKWFKRVSMLRICSTYLAIPLLMLW